MWLDFLFQIWRRLHGEWQWRLLWLFNAKFMVSVAGVVRDALGQVLLLRHRHWVADVWGLPGGIVHSRETLEAALQREVLEETGLAITEVRLLQVTSGYKLRLAVYFSARLAGQSTATRFHLQESEILEARFFPPGELPANMLAQQRAIVQSALE